MEVPVEPEERGVVNHNKEGCDTAKTIYKVTSPHERSVDYLYTLSCFVRGLYLATLLGDVSLESYSHTDSPLRELEVDG